MASSSSLTSSGCGLSCAHLRNSLKASGSVPSSSSSSSLNSFKNTKSSRFMRQRMTTTTAKTNNTHAFNASSFNSSSRRRRREQRGETKSRKLKAVPAWHPENKNDVPFDEPTPGFSSIPSALEEIKKGKFVVVLDDEDRENEGDLIGAADLMTQESMAVMIRHTSG